MTGEPPPWADGLLTLWVVAVAAFYFGGYFAPAVGALTQAGAGLYVLMLLCTAGTLAFRFLPRAGTDSKAEPKTESKAGAKTGPKKDARTENRK